MTASTCPSCGAPLAPGERSCPGCGTAIAITDAPTRLVPHGESFAPGAVVRERQAHIVIVLGRTWTREYHHDRNIITIGRDTIQDVVLDNPSVSRQHCQLRYDPERGFLLEDVGSENRSLHNGRVVRDPVALSPGDEIGVGKFSVLFNPTAQQLARLEARPAAAQGPALDAPAPATTHLSDAELASVRRELDLERAAHLRPVGKELTRRIPLGKAATVLGRGAKADVVLDGWFIAERHAIIMRSMDGQNFRLTHEAGLRRVRVNGRVVEQHVLRDHDRIAIGKTVLQFFPAVK